MYCVRNFATSKTAVENGSAIIVSNSSLSGLMTHYGLCQTKITGTMTVLLQGRVSSAQDWTTLATFTASGLQEVLLLPEMRYSITANGGSLDAMDVAFLGR